MQVRVGGTTILINDHELPRFEAALAKALELVQSATDAAMTVGDGEEINRLVTTRSYLHELHSAVSP